MLIDIPIVLFSTQYAMWILGAAIGVLVSAALFMLMWTINSRKEQWFS